jgi:large subunit ribosomal protein L31
MKTDIHPNYQEISATCSCGNVLPVMSTLKDNLSLDVCSKCHPFYTGKQKMLDSGGRVKKFQDRFGASGASKSEPKKEESKVEELVIENSTDEIVETAAEVAEVAEVAEENLAENVAEEASEELVAEDSHDDSEQSSAEDDIEESKD